MVVNGNPGRPAGQCHREQTAGATPSGGGGSTLPGGGFGFIGAWLGETLVVTPDSNPFQPDGSLPPDRTSDTGDTGRTDRHGARWS